MTTNFCNRCLLVIGAAAIGIVTGCASPRTDAAFAKYDDAKGIEIIDLKRTSQSWDGVEFRYRRPWEKDEEPWKTLRLVVNTVGGEQRGQSR